jgi:PhoH-like ATPase
MSRKKYVLDTSVLIHDPQSFKSFHNSDVILPITVLDELDKLKKMPGGAGKNARVVIRMLDTLCNSAPDINAGMLLDNDLLFSIDATSYAVSNDIMYGDNRILACAQEIHKLHKEDVILVSNDINMRVRARALGLMAEAYEANASMSADLYPGIRYITDEVAGSDLITLGTIFPPTYEHQFSPNECVVFQDEEGNEIAKGRQINNGNMKLIKKFYPWDLSPRNKEQEFAIELIMDPKVPLVTLIGRAGTGKSLVALASALELVLEKRQYDKLIIYRPIQPVGNDIGYLPGTMEEKLAPWFQAIMDNFEVLFSSRSGDKWRSNFEAVRRRDKIQMEAITYIRGRSIPNALIILDEAQNLSKDEIKTILTRVGEGTKIILNGDLEQIDAKNLDPINNGLVYTIEKFKTSSLAGHVTFTQGERSDLATEAAKVL